MDVPELTNVLAILMIAMGVVTASALAHLPAPYGRYARKGWGPTIPSVMGWIIQESPSFLVPVTVLVSGSDYFLTEMSWSAKLMATCFLAHYLHRAFIYPLSTRPSKQTPILVSLLAYLFTTWNGLLQVYMWLDVQHWEKINLGLWALGICIWFTGAVLNIQSDYHLLDLRLKRGSGYHIPTTGLFKYVSGANFLGEILEWMGYAIASQHIAGYAFAWFTLCNIGPRAMHHHQNYKALFRGAYPRHRKALIPFLL